MEQNKNAKAAGAAGIVNMAPDPTSNYIWILQGTARDSVSGSAGDNRNRGASVVVDPSAVGLELIPHVAVSGVSGTRLYGRLLEAPGTVYITSQNEVEPESGIMVMDLVRASACLHLDSTQLYLGRKFCFCHPGGKQLPETAAAARLARSPALLIAQLVILSPSPAPSRMHAVLSAVCIVLKSAQPLTSYHGRQSPLFASPWRCLC